MITKHIVAFFVAAVMLFSLSVSVFAGEILSTDIPVESTYGDGKYESSEESKTLHSVYSCEYDPISEQISINGTVPHDLFIRYSNYSIEVYKISTFTDESEEGFELVATSEMTIKFHFSFAAKSILDIFDRYTVRFVSQSGEVDYIGPELYPSVESKYALDNKDFYKGLTLREDIPYVRANASTYILPIEYQRLFNLNIGYLYMLDETSFFFDRDYLNKIDSQVRTLSACGAKIYFQLLMPEDDTVGKYQTLSLGELENVRRMYACFDFLSNRYNSDTNGKISGVILGKKLNSFISNQVQGYDAAEYSQNLAVWGIIASNAVRQNIPSADVVYSFSNVNSFDGRSVNESLGYASSDIIERISKFFDDYYSGGFDFSIMLESDITPFNITSEAFSEKMIEQVPDSTYISPQTVNVVSNYLDIISDKYISSPGSFIYYWEIKEDLNEKTLGAVYAYTYYKLINNPRVNAFVADLGNVDKAAFTDILTLFKDIDSPLGMQRADSVLEFFGVSDWKQIISNFDEENLISNLYMRAEPLVIRTKEIKGSFSYFDCIDSTKVLPWRKGVGCQTLSISYNTLAGRSLKAHFNSDGVPNGEYSYLIYKDEYPENYVHTQYLVFDLSIDNDERSGMIPYEVKITLGEGKDILECSRSVTSGKKEQIIFDVSEFSQKHKSDYIKIAVRPLVESSSEYSLYISSVVGLSDEYTSDELSELIERERLIIRDQLENDDSAENKNKISAFAVILVIGIIVGATLFIFLRHDDDSSTKNHKE